MFGFILDTLFVAAFIPSIIVAYNLCHCVMPNSTKSDAVLDFSPGNGEGQEYPEEFHVCRSDEEEHDGNGQRRNSVLEKKLPEREGKPRTFPERKLRRQARRLEKNGRGGRGERRRKKDAEKTQAKATAIATVTARCSDKTNRKSQPIRAVKNPCPKNTEQILEHAPNQDAFIEESSDLEPVTKTSNECDDVVRDPDNCHDRVALPDGRSDTSSEDQHSPSTITCDSNCCESEKIVTSNVDGETPEDGSEPEPPNEELEPTYRNDKTTNVDRAGSESDQTCETKSSTPEQTSGSAQSTVEVANEPCEQMNQKPDSPVKSPVPELMATTENMDTTSERASPCEPNGDAQEDSSNEKGQSTISNQEPLPKLSQTTVSKSKPTHSTLDELDAKRETSMADDVHGKNLERFECGPDDLSDSDSSSIHYRSSDSNKEFKSLSNTGNVKGCCNNGESTLNKEVALFTTASLESKLSSPEFESVVRTEKSKDSADASSNQELKNTKECEFQQSSTTPSVESRERVKQSQYLATTCSATNDIPNSGKFALVPNSLDQQTIGYPNEGEADIPSKEFTAEILSSKQPLETTTYLDSEKDVVSVEITTTAQEMPVFTTSSTVPEAQSLVSSATCSVDKIETQHTVEVSADSNTHIQENGKLPRPEFDINIKIIENQEEPSQYNADLNSEAGEIVLEKSIGSSTKCENLVLDQRAPQGFTGQLSSKLKSSDTISGESTISDQHACDNTDPAEGADPAGMEPMSSFSSAVDTLQELTAEAPEQKKTSSNDLEESENRLNQKLEKHREKNSKTLRGDDSSLLLEHLHQDDDDSTITDDLPENKQLPSSRNGVGEDQNTQTLDCSKSMPMETGKLETENHKSHENQFENTTPTDSKQVSVAAGVHGGNLERFGCGSDRLSDSDSSSIHGNDSQQEFKSHSNAGSVSGCCNSKESIHNKEIALFTASPESELSSPKFERMVRTERCEDLDDASTNQELDIDAKECEFQPVSTIFIEEMPAERQERVKQSQQILSTTCSATKDIPVPGKSALVPSGLDQQAIGYTDEGEADILVKEFVEEILSSEVGLLLETTTYVDSEKDVVSVEVSMTTEKLPDLINPFTVSEAESLVPSGMSLVDETETRHVVEQSTDSNTNIQDSDEVPRPEFDSNAKIIEKQQQPSPNADLNSEAGETVLEKSIENPTICRNFVLDQTPPRGFTGEHRNELKSSDTISGESTVSEERAGNDTEPSETAGLAEIESVPSFCSAVDTLQELASEQQKTSSDDLQGNESNLSQEVEKHPVKICDTVRGGDTEVGRPDDSELNEINSGSCDASSFNSDMESISWLFVSCESNLSDESLDKKLSTERLADEVSDPERNQQQQDKNISDNLRDDMKKQEKLTNSKEDSCQKLKPETVKCHTMHHLEPTEFRVAVSDSSHSSLYQTASGSSSSDSSSDSVNIEDVSDSENLSNPASDHQKTKEKRKKIRKMWRLTRLHGSKKPVSKFDPLSDSNSCSSRSSVVEAESRSSSTSDDSQMSTVETVTFKDLLKRNQMKPKKKLRSKFIKKREKFVKKMIKRVEKAEKMRKKVDKMVEEDIKYEEEERKKEEKLAEKKRRREGNDLNLEKGVQTEQTEEEKTFIKEEILVEEMFIKFEKEMKETEKVMKKMRSKANKKNKKKEKKEKKKKEKESKRELKKIKKEQQESDKKDKLAGELHGENKDDIDNGEKGSSTEKVTVKKKSSLSNAIKKAFLFSSNERKAKNKRKKHSIVENTEHTPQSDVRDSTSQSVVADTVTHEIENTLETAQSPDFSSDELCSTSNSDKEEPATQSEFMKSSSMESGQISDNEISEEVKPAHQQTNNNSMQICISNSSIKT